MLRAMCPLILACRVTRNLQVILLPIIIGGRICPYSRSLRQHVWSKRLSLLRDTCLLILACRVSLFKDFHPTIL